MMTSIERSCTAAEQLKEAVRQADAVLIGAGAGLSASAGFTYSGERFKQHFSDFIEKYQFTDMYTAGFYSFPTLEEHWAYWSRHIFYNRYVPAPKPAYDELLSLVRDKDYFVLTTNADHQFQRAGFERHRLFYTQGDYGLWQCSLPCHEKTYDNEETVRKMIEQQKEMKVPSELVPRCPVCGRPMEMNLRADDTFVEDEGWHRAAQRYQEFYRRCGKSRLVLLELGVGGNTPGIIKYPFWQMTASNPQAVYACLNDGEAFVPRELADQSILINADIGRTLEEIEQGARI